jgi:hypothetical protein
MKQSLFVALMVTNVGYRFYFEKIIEDTLRSTTMTKDIRITDIQFITDKALQTIFWNLEQYNKGPEVPWVRIETLLLQVDIESEASLMLKKLPWLDAAMKSIVEAEELQPIGIYTYYLIEEGEEIKFHITNRLINTTSNMEDVMDDDFSYLQQMAGFVYAYLYGDTEPYAPVMAKLLLQDFGG